MLPIHLDLPAWFVNPACFFGLIKEYWTLLLLWGCAFGFGVITEWAEMYLKWLFTVPFRSADQSIKTFDWRGAVPRSKLLQEPLRLLWGAFKQLKHPQWCWRRSVSAHSWRTRGSKTYGKQPLSSLFYTFFSSFLTKPAAYSATEVW